MKFIYSIQSEWLKRKRSSVSWLVLVGGFFIPLIIIIARLVYRSETVMNNSTDGIWLKLYNQCWQYMAVFLLPMGITLAASLITQIEYRNNAWKQVYTSPQAVSTIFWAKYVVVLIILVQFFMLFNIGIYSTGLIPAIIYADVPYPKEPFPFWRFVIGNYKFFIDCLPILALQYLLSLHIKNFIVPIGVGFALLIASIIGMSWHYGYLLPYTYIARPFIAADKKIDAGINTERWACAYFVFFTLLNYVLFVLKSQTKLSGLLRKKRIKHIAMLSLCALLFFIAAELLGLFGNKQTSKVKANSVVEIDARI